MLETPQERKVRETKNSTISQSHSDQKQEIELYDSTQLREKWFRFQTYLLDT
jgi:hypothetical protein